MKISIIICAYNPRIDYFIQVLNGLKIAAEQINGNSVEILLIDNNSNNGYLSDSTISLCMQEMKINLCSELQQGLSHARRCGIKCSSGDYLVFIDDDNIMESDFLLNGVKAAQDYPFLGCFSGNVELIFEQGPDRSLNKYMGLLARRDVQRDVWSNEYFLDTTMPCGVGLWVKRDVAEFYLSMSTRGRNILVTDRVGDELTSGGDNDLAMCAIDLGFGIGLMKNLKVRHLIPKNRVEIRYLLRLNEGIEYSAVILKFFRIGFLFEYTWKNKIGDVLRILLLSRVDARFYLSTIRGRVKALKKLKYNENTTNS